MTNSILDLFKGIIHEDIPKLKNSLDESSKIEKLLLRLAGSDEINPEKIAGITGFKKQEIIALFEILTKAEILKNQLKDNPSQENIANMLKFYKEKLLIIEENIQNNRNKDTQNN
jgi:hypothetical protein